MAPFDLKEEILRPVSYTHLDVYKRQELGMEAIWKIEVEAFPAFILVDDKGNDFFAKIREGWACAGCGPVSYTHLKSLDLSEKFFSTAVPAGSPSSNRLVFSGSPTRCV